MAKKDTRSRSMTALALYAVARRDLRALERKSRPILRFPLAVAYAAAVCLFAAVAFSGCASAPPPQRDPNARLDSAGQPDAALVRILASFGEPTDARPYVLWITGEGQCGNVAWLHDDGRCLRGAFYPDMPRVIAVATWPGAHVAQTSLAHEALHWLLWRKGIDSSAHMGNFYERAEAANRDLWDDER